MQNLETTISSLIRAVGLGNKEAIEKFKVIYVPSILSVCRKVLKDETKAQAATLATVKSMIRAAETFDRKKHGSFRTYLRRTIRSKIADNNRSIFAAKKRDERDWSKRLNQALVRQALQLAKQKSNISKANWEQFHLHYEQGWDREALAEKFGKTTESVGKTLWRCCKQIKEQLKVINKSGTSTTQETDS